MDDIDRFFAESLLKPFPEADEKASLFLATLLAASREGHLCLITEEDPSLPEPLIGEFVVRSDNRWYLRRNWDCEHSLLKHWKRLADQTPSPSFTIDEALFEGIPLQPEQKEAIKNATKRTVSLISGGPGTGKTFTAAALIRLLFESKVGRIAVAAPTGKATANLREGLGEIAEKCTVKTLHALLKNRGTLPFDLLVVDEGSMIDAALMARLFAAMKERGRLVILGDKDQLPPVDSGHFFGELITHKKEVVTTLTTCLRAESQEIIDLATAVKRGETIPYAPLPSVDDLLQRILPHLDNENFCLLTPLKEGPYGVKNLNNRIQKERGGQGPIPIMITVNDHRLGLFNGDKGILIGEEVHFPDGRTFPRYALPRFELAYVLSVHKSQGSEYEEALVVLPEGAQNFGRELLYTALTRARRKVEVFGREGIVEEMLQKQTSRESGFRFELPHLSQV